MRIWTFCLLSGRFSGLKLNLIKIFFFLLGRYLRAYECRQFLGTSFRGFVERVVAEEVIDYKVR